MRFFPWSLRSPIWSVSQLGLVWEYLRGCRFAVFVVDLVWGIAIVLSSRLYVPLCQVCLLVSWPYWRFLHVLLPLVFLSLCGFLCHLVYLTFFYFVVFFENNNRRALMSGFCFRCLMASCSLLGRLVLGVITPWWLHLYREVVILPLLGTFLMRLMAGLVVPSLSSVLLIWVRPFVHPFILADVKFQTYLRGV